MQKMVLSSAALLVLSEPCLAQFTPEQAEAFDRGAGVEGENIFLLVSSITTALAFGGVAWIAYAAFQNWTDGRSSSGSVASLLLRASVLLVVVALFLR